MRSSPHQRGHGLAASVGAGCEAPPAGNRTRRIEWRRPAGRQAECPILRGPPNRKTKGRYLMADQPSTSVKDLVDRVLEADRQEQIARRTREVAAAIGEAAETASQR